MNYTTLLKRLGEDIEDVKPAEAKGKVLAGGYMHHTAGTTVTPEMIKEFKDNKIDKISVSRHPPKVSFMVRPLARNPLLNPDWMARLGHRYLKESILEGAHLGQESDIHGTHPVPAYVYGREFGRGPGGKY